MSAKQSDDCLLTVGEFAATVGATRSQLLYYDRRGVFAPMIRREAGRQAANRFYTADQIYNYHVFSFYQQTGCSLDSAERLVNRSPGENAGFLERQIQLLEEKRAHLLRMEEALTVTLRLERLIQGSSAARPVFLSLPEAWLCRYMPFAEACVRGTRRFAELYAGALGAIAGDGGLLPFPVGLVYSPNTTEDGHFPVKGVLALASKDAAPDKANRALPAGRYLVFGVKNRLSHFADDCMPSRGYLLGHALRRATPIVGWNLRVESGGDGSFYTECVFFGVVDGDTPAGELPILPGVE